MTKGDSSSSVIAFVCITCFTCLTLADDSVPCGFTVCNPRGYVFCAKPPLIDEGDDPYCVGCETQQEQCENMEIQPGCEQFCKEHLFEKWSRNFTENDQNLEKGVDNTSLGGRTLIALIAVSSALFCVFVFTIFLLLDRTGILNLPCWLPRFKRRKRKGRRTNSKEPTAPRLVETARLIDPSTQDDVTVVDETSLKTTSGGDARRPSSDVDSTSNTSESSHTSSSCRPFNNIPATNLNSEHTDEIAVG